jgi:hypothetical protein
MKKANEKNEETEAAIKEDTVKVITEPVTEDSDDNLTVNSVPQIETIVYCGPTIKGVVTQYAHFNNGIPKKLKEYAETNKLVKRLLVPLQEFIETKKNIQVTGTVENVTFDKIKKGE